MADFHNVMERYRQEFEVKKENIQYISEALLILHKFSFSALSSYIQQNIISLNVYEDEFSSEKFGEYRLPAIYFSVTGYKSCQIIIFSTLDDYDHRPMFIMSRMEDRKGRNDAYVIAPETTSFDPNMSDWGVRHARGSEKQFTQLTRAGFQNMFAELASAL